MAKKKSQIDDFAEELGSSLAPLRRKRKVGLANAHR
jgi:hypothetical protein